MGSEGRRRLVIASRESNRIDLDRQMAAFGAQMLDSDKTRSTVDALFGVVWNIQPAHRARNPFEKIGKRVPRIGIAAVLVFGSFCA